MTCACASGAHGEGPALATAFAAVLPSGCAASRRQSTARTPRFLSVARSSSLISNGPSRSLLRYRERLRRPERAARLAGRIRELSGPDAAVVATGDTTAPASSRWSRPAGRSSTSTPRPTPSSTRSATTSSTTDRIPSRARRRRDRDVRLRERPRRERRPVRPRRGCRPVDGSPDRRRNYRVRRRHRPRDRLSKPDGRRPHVRRPRRRRE